MQTVLKDILDKYPSQLPVPVISIAKDLGLEIYETKDFEEWQSGSLKKEDEKFVIYLNANHSASRKRFTIAHEIAHFLKHKKYLEDKGEIVEDTKQPIEKPALNRNSKVKTADSQKYLEAEANQLAAEILMPEDEFKKAWKESNDVEDLSVRFGVSPTAITIRAKELLNSFMI